MTALGGIIGLIGVWGFVVHKAAVPSLIRTTHAHINWWGIIAMLAAIGLPVLTKSTFLGSPERTRRILAIAFFVATFIWLGGMVAIYTTGSIYLGAFASIAEVIFVILILLIVYWIIKEKSAWFAAWPRFYVLGGLAILFISVLLGLAIIAQYKVENPHFYLSTSQLRALPTTHVHLAILPMASLVYLAIASMIANVPQNTVKKISMIFLVALALYPFLFLAWHLGGSRYIPMISEAIFYIGALSVFVMVILSLRKQGPVDSKIKPFYVYLLALNLFLVGVGAYLAISKVAPFSAYTYGWYPKDTDWVYWRNIENLHFSPGSWTFSKMAALLGIVLLPLSLPTKMYLATLAALAPTFNAIGRYTAAIGFPPGGPGALILAAHPIFVLFQLSAIIAAFYVWWKYKKSIYPVESS